MLTCAVDGSSQSEVRCDEADVCAQLDGTVSCVAVVCAPDEIGCTDGVTAYLCDSTGTSRTLLPCTTGQYCSEGRCLDQVCEPSSVTCEGRDRVQCDASGSSRVVLACNDGANCSPGEFGCICDEGSCVQRTCQPGTGRCVGNSGQMCMDDGLGYTEPGDCGSTNVCVGGECLPRVCTVGTSRCAGDSIVSCSGAGTLEISSTCDTTNVCVQTGSLARCEPRVCEPRQITCTSDARSRQTCNDSGTAFGVAACSTGSSCRGGECIPQICQPGSRVCRAGDVAVCNTVGLGLSTVDDCDADEICFNAECRELLCAPDSLRCDGAVSVRCDGSGLGESRTDCAGSGQFCNATNGLCDTRVCTPGTLRCQQNEVLLCNSIGSVESITQTCSLGCDGGECVTGCGDGTLEDGEQCDDGNLASDDGCSGECELEDSCTSASFDGVRNTRRRAELLEPRSVTTGSTWTIEAWVRIRSVTEYGLLWYMQPTVTSRGRVIVETAGNIGYGANRNRWGTEGGGPRQFSNANVPLSTWHHIAGVFDRGTYRFYVNGVLNVTTTTTVTTGFGGSVNGYLAVGSSPPTYPGDPGNVSLDGEVDVVRISNFARYTANFEPASTLAADSGTEHLYNFSEGEGTTTRDEITGGSVPFSGIWSSTCAP